MITRRTTLLTGAALLCAPRVSLSSTPSTLRAAPGELQIAPLDYEPTAIWRYDLDGRMGAGTGPVLRARQGDRLALRLQNDLPAPTTVHWHGVRLENAMDGVPGVTQAPVSAGESFDYAFDLLDAGTFWYHSHVDSVQQLARGLHGPLIVEEDDGPDVDDDIVLVMDDWRLDNDAAISQDFNNRHDMSHAGRLGNVVTTNGDPDWRRTASQGDRFRLRLINVANARVFNLELRGLDAWVVALDGMPLATPRRSDNRFSVAPGQRVDLIVDVIAEPGESAGLVEIIREEAFAQATFDVTGMAVSRGTAPTPLPPNPVLGTLEMDEAQQLEVRIEGGAMRGLRQAMSHGVVKDGRTLATEEGLFWALSGQAGRPKEPFTTLSRGETAIIDYVNETAFPHAMHLHGHHAHELAANGSLGDFRDTTLVQPGETRRVAFAAHNPGDWLLHCHMLGHHASGMGTWFRVT